MATYKKDQRTLPQTITINESWFSMEFTACIRMPRSPRAWMLISSKHNTAENEKIIHIMFTRRLWKQWKNQRLPSRTRNIDRTTHPQTIYSPYRSEPSLNSRYLHFDDRRKVWWHLTTNTSFTKIFTRALFAPRTTLRSYSHAFVNTWIRQETNALLAHPLFMVYQRGGRMAIPWSMFFLAVY